MADANIRAVITADDRASAVLQGFSTKTVAIGTAIGQIFAHVASDAIQALTNDIGEAVKRVDTLGNANRTFENMGFQTSQVKASMDALNKSILGLPTPLDQAVQGVELLASASNDVSKGQQVFSALNDAVLGFGGSAYMAQGATLQLSQDIAGGVLHASTWNSLLQDGLGPTLAAMARQMGMTTADLRDGLSKGTISVQTFQDKLIDLDKHGGGGLKSLHQIALDSTSGIQTSMANAQTAITRALAGIIQSIGQANIANAITATGKAVAELVTWFGELGKAAVPVINGALKTLKPAIDDLWKAIQQNLMPILIQLWDKVLKPLAPVIGTVIVGAIYGLIEALSLLINIVTGTITTIENVFQTLKDSISMVFDLFTGGDPTLKAAHASSGAWQEFAKILASVHDFIYRVIDGFNATIAFVGGAWRTFTNFISSTWNAMVAIVSGALHQFITNFWGDIGFAIGYILTLPLKLVIGLGVMLAQAYTKVQKWIIDTDLAFLKWVEGIVNYLANINWGALFKRGADAMGKMLSDIWNGVTTTFNNIVNYIVNINWAGVAGSIGHAFGSMWDGVKGAAMDAWNFLKSINWGGILVSIGKGLGNAIIDLLNGVLRGAFAGIPGLKDHAPQVPHFAAGVQNFGGGMAVVGERGPELVQLPRGSNVIPNGQINTASNQTIHITLNGVFTGTPSDARKLARMVADNLKDIAGAKNMTVAELLG